jgi:flagellar motor switch protein FliG
MRIRIQFNCWRAVSVVSVAATITVVAESLRVPQPPLPPGAEASAGLPSLTPPMPPSPVDNFRDWLKLTPAQREPLLAQLPAADRKALEAKLANYDSLSPDARDLRLRETQLHWQLLALMKLPTAERKERLAQVPTQYLDVVQERLRQWDAFAAAKQKIFLEHEQEIGVYLELQETAPQERGKVLSSMPPEVRFPLERRLQKWNNMPPPQRQELSDRFTQMFQSEERERAKIIAALPDDVRKPFENLAAQLKQLPEEQRNKCTVALKKFLKMSPDNQRQFLQNAMRWQKMDEKQHDAWRQIVNKVPQLPPLPPGMDPPAPPPLIAGTNSVVPANAP